MAMAYQKVWQFVSVESVEKSASGFWYAKIFMKEINSKMEYRCHLKFNNEPSYKYLEVEALNYIRELNFKEAEAAQIQNPIPAINFLNRFTDSELSAFLTIAKTEIAVEIFIEKYRLTGIVYLDNLVTTNAINTAIDKKALTATRASEILKIMV